MQINPTFAFASGSTSTDISEFENAVDTVIDYYDSIFSASNVVLNVDFAYGEQFSSTNSNNTSVNYVAMPSASQTSSFDLGTNVASLDSTSYSSLRDSLQSKDNGLQQTAYATLPASSPFGNDTLLVTTAQAKALGMTPVGTLAGEDGVVGIVSNEELQAGGLSADWTEAAPSNADQFYMVGAIEHELSEVMGRVSFDGEYLSGVGPSYTLMDLFRYAAPEVRQTSDGNPAYFSIDNGNSAYYYWNNPALAAGDLGDWAPSGPNGTDPTGNDAYLNASSPGVVNSVSAYDLDLMNAVGWNLSSAPPSPPPVSASTPPASLSSGPTSALLVQGVDGNLEYLEYAGTSLVESSPVSYTTDRIVAEGDFSNNGSTDLVAQNPHTGAIDLLFLDNGVLQSSVLEPGSYWHVVGAGDFDGNGQTEIATQSSATGQVDLLTFDGAQLASSVLLNGSYQHVVGTTDFDGDGKAGLITQNPDGGPLDFLTFNGDDLSSSQQTSDSFWPVHDAVSFGTSGQSVLVSQKRGTNQIAYLEFDQTQFAGSMTLGGDFAGLTPVQGTQAASQLFATSF